MAENIFYDDFLENKIAEFGENTIGDEQQDVY